MADTFTPSTKSQEAVPAVPSSASEISIRTMGTDLEMMGKSGGMAGSSMQVTRIPNANHPEPEIGVLGVPVANNSPTPERSWTRPLIWTLIILASGGILFALGFYVIPAFFK